MKNSPKPGIEKNPLMIVIGSAVVGTIAAALIPRSAREHKILGPAGRHLRKRAQSAADAAIAVGKEQLDNHGINRDAATAQLRDLAQKLGQTATAAGSAAVKAARK